MEEVLERKSNELHKEVVVVKKERTERKIWIDVIKIISIFGVILIHVAAEYWNHLSIYTSRWTAMNFWNSIGRFGVPAFIMASRSIIFREKRTYI